MDGVGVSGIMVVLAAVAAGSAPGVLPGRGVAGCCASGLQVSDGEDGLDPSAPVPAGADSPTDSVGGPQHRFGVGGPVVVDRVQMAIDAGEGVGDGGPVPGLLGGVLVVEHPGRDSGADHQPGGGLDEQTPGGRPGHAFGAPGAEDDRGEVFDAGHGVEDDSLPSSGLIGGMDAPLAGEQKPAKSAAGVVDDRGGRQRHGHHHDPRSFALVGERPHA